MANAPMPPIAPRTAMWGLGFKLESIGNKFNKLYTDIKDVWVIGKWLSWPFYLINLYFQGAKTKCWQVDQLLVKWISWIQGIVDGNTLIELLENLWYDFRLLKTNPIEWIKLKLDVLSNEYRSLRENPLEWIRARIFIAIPVLSAVVFNSGYWIYTKLAARFPNIGGFITNPIGKIKSWVLSSFLWARELNIGASYTAINWINGVFPWFKNFLYSPSTTVRNLLTQYSYDVNLLLTEPIRWFKEKLANALGLSYADIVNIPVALIKKLFSVILSNQGGILSYVERAFCDVIMRFI